MDIMDILGVIIMVPLIFGFAQADANWSMGSHLFRDVKTSLWDD